MTNSTPSGNVLLRAVTEDDLPVFFEQQCDPEAAQMAGFPSRQRDAFMVHWVRVLANDCNIHRTILFDGNVAGNIVSWEQAGEQDVGYWLGREYWGRGIATRALAAFLKEVKIRPLYAHVVRHNHASMRVLEKCGFERHGEQDDEVILMLASRTIGAKPSIVHRAK